MSPLPSTIEFIRLRPGRSERVAEVDFVEPNLNLLAHAQTIELEIGSRCGGHGKCGGDRVRVSSLSGEGNLNLSALTEAEREHLTPEELAQGVRLACQCFPNDSNTSFRVEILTP